MFLENEDQWMSVRRLEECFGVPGSGKDGLRLEPEYCCRRAGRKAEAKLRLFR